MKKSAVAIDMARTSVVVRPLEIAGELVLAIVAIRNVSLFGETRMHGGCAAAARLL
jgi:hypothetical protein